MATFSYDRPPRQQQSSSSTLAQTPPICPSTPSEFFMHSLRAEEKTGWALGVLCPGANTNVLLKLHIEETYHTTMAPSPVCVFVVHVETPLPTGGTHTARLDSWEKGNPEAPLWLADIPDPSSPLQFTRTLGWLYAIVRAIEARPGRREGDVWSRFLGFLDNVKEAYRVAPTLRSPNLPRARPRPRPRYAGANALADALAVLRLTDADTRGATHPEM